MIGMEEIIKVAFNKTSTNSLSTLLIYIRNLCNPKKEKKVFFAFENVNTESLKSSLQELQSLFSSNSEKKILTSLSKKENFLTSASTPLLNGLKKLIDERYEDLQKTISNYLSIVSKIENYNAKKKELLSLAQKINDELDEEETDYEYISNMKESQVKYLKEMGNIVLDVDSLI